MCTQFQFQKGAIKTGGGLPLPGGEPLFQFQKGAIKTPGEYDNTNIDDNFNSKKVRLRQTC